MAPKDEHTGDPIPIGSDAKKARKKSMSVRDIRRRRARKALIRFGIWCGLPTLLAVIYYGFIAAPEYQSTTIFSVQSSKDRPTLDSLAAAFIPTAGSTKDTRLVLEYVHSRAMLELLDKKVHILDHYKSDKADFWSRLDSDASKEEAYSYYRKKVHIHFSSDSSALTLTVRAFTAEKAHEISRAILEAAEVMVNNLADRARADHLRVAKAAVAEGEKRLAAARKKLIALQGDQAVLDPRLKAEAVTSITTGLENQLAQERAKLSSLLAYLQPTAPQVVQQRHTVNSLAGQLAAQRRRLLGNTARGKTKAGKHDTSVKTSFAEFEPAILEKELSQKGYEAALKTLELARFEAAKQHRYLVTISAPSLPDAPTHPRRAWSILTVFVVSLLLMGVVTLLWASIREHANF